MKFFEPYITRLIPMDISLNALEQLNSVLCSFARAIADVSIRLVEVSKKKRLSEKELRGAICILFQGELRDFILTNGTIAINKFNSSFILEQQTLEEVSIEPTRREDRAAIIFPPSLTEKFLRRFGYSNLMLTSTTPVFLASILETIASYLINRSIQYVTKDRISPRAFELAIRGDAELDRVFKNLGIKLLGGGVVPFIHPILRGEEVPKPLIASGRGVDRLQAGELALKEIEKYQSMSNQLVFARQPFGRVIRRIVSSFDGGKVKISSGVFDVIQYFVEQQVIELLRKANMAAIHAGRVKMSSEDIAFIKSIIVNR